MNFADYLTMERLTTAIETIPLVPKRIDGLGWFDEKSTDTTSVFIEKKAGSNQLVAAAGRRDDGQEVQDSERDGFSIPCTNLPQKKHLWADDLQNIRKFATEDQLEALQDKVNEILKSAKRNFDATIEWHRMGAIKGQVLDKDGTTVITDMFTKFGLSKNEVGMALDTNTDVRQSLVNVQRISEEELVGVTPGMYHCLCSPLFLDKLVRNASVKEAWNRWNAGSFNRDDHRIGFEFAGVRFEEYRHKVGDKKYLEDGEALLVPTGVEDLFQTYFSPTIYEQTVNTMGRPYYVSPKKMDHNKGYEFEMKSHPTTVCTNPSSIIHLTV